MIKQSEQTQGQQLLKQLKDEYRRPGGRDTEAAVESMPQEAYPILSIGQQRSAARSINP